MQIMDALQELLEVVSADRFTERPSVVYVLEELAAHRWFLRDESYLDFAAIRFGHLNIFLALVVPYDVLVPELHRGTYLLFEHFYEVRVVGVLFQVKNFQSILSAVWRMGQLYLGTETVAECFG